MNNLTQDALRLSETILDSLLPNEGWVIVNIAQINQKTFKVPTWPGIPTSFGYEFDKVPDLLIEEGVIEMLASDHWFTDVTSLMLLEGESINQMTVFARGKGYIKQNENIEFMWTGIINGVKMYWRGSYRGQYAALINRKQLEVFIKYCKNLGPKFNEETGTFEFLGETVNFEGKVEIKSVQLLVQNLNSIVAKEDFYKVRGKEDYQVIKKEHGVTRLHDVLEKVFDKIKKKFETNPKLKDTIKLVQKDGFGMFINTKATLQVKS